MSIRNSHASQDTSSSISKSLIILSSFADNAPIQSTSDIAARLNMSISTVSRHLNILMDEGYLLRNDATGLYSLGYKILTMAGIVLYSNPLYQFSKIEFPIYSIYLQWEYIRKSAI